MYLFRSTKGGFALFVLLSWFQIDHFAASPSLSLSEEGVYTDADTSFHPDDLKSRELKKGQRTRGHCDKLQKLNSTECPTHCPKFICNKVKEGTIEDFCKTLDPTLECDTKCSNAYVNNTCCSVDKCQQQIADKAADRKAKIATRKCKMIKKAGARVSSGKGCPTRCPTKLRVGKKTAAQYCDELDDCKDTCKTLYDTRGCCTKSGTAKPQKNFNGDRNRMTKCDFIQKFKDNADLKCPKYVCKMVKFGKDIGQYCDKQQDCSDTCKEVFIDSGRCSEQSCTMTEVSILPIVQEDQQMKNPNKKKYEEKQKKKNNKKV
jgi:hypothetical protein